MKATAAGQSSADTDESSRPTLSVGSMIKEIQSLKDKFKSEDKPVESPFQDLEKATVLQECRVFNDSNVVTQHPKRCCQLITKLLHILNTGETFSSSETMEVFFGVTKLFQSQDSNLRRMVYLFIKEVADACNPDDVIIVTSSLTKDMNSQEDLYRANSIRVLARIIDTAMLSAIERYIKQAIVDKNGLVAASALLAGQKLLLKSPDIVRRWVSEVQEALNSSDDMVQFHGLALLYSIKQHDKLAVSKLVAQLSKGSLRSPLAICMLIRYLSNLLGEDLNATNARAAYQFLEQCLRHRSEVVIFEAARAICRLPGCEQTDLAPAVTVLQLFLSSPKPTLRFAAIRCLSDVSIIHPISVIKCNPEMETLISDPNRSIATLAITTLLKTGSESSIDRLMKQISTFMSEIADEFRVMVIQSIHQLCIKYPQKHRVLIGFMATFLREEGGFEFKKAIVDSVVELMSTIPETKETSLFHLCEFIEDCEFTALYTQILHLLGEMGPSTSAPARYIRFVYNRIILEKAVVRAAAVSALGKFGARCPNLRLSVITLLKRSLLDEDDEVRDRAATILKILESEDPSSQGSGISDAEFLLVQGLPMSFGQLERSLKAYIARPSPGPLTFQTLPVVEAPSVAPLPTAGRSDMGMSGGAAGDSAGAKPGSEPEDYAAAVYAEPRLSHLGRVFRSTQPSELTESETEYVVRCVRHIFDDRVVLEFKVTNTINDQKLKDVQVVVEIEETELYQQEADLSCPSIAYGETKSCFVVLKRALDHEIEQSIFNCELRFKVVEVDPQSGEPDGDEDGFPEEYPLEKLTISISDYMAKVNLGDFRRSWEKMADVEEVTENFGLTKFSSLSEAVEGVILALGMQPCDGTAIIPSNKADATSHQIHLSGIFVTNVPVLVRCLIKLHPQQGFVLTIGVRSGNPDVSKTVANSIEQI